MTPQRRAAYPRHEQTPLPPRGSARPRRNPCRGNPSGRGGERCRRRGRHHRPGQRLGRHHPGPRRALVRGREPGRVRSSRAPGECGRDAPRSRRAQAAGATELQTQSVSVSPRYGAQMAVQGYVAQNSVSATIRQLGQAGAVIDAAVAAGANQVYGPSLVRGDQAELYRRALRAAVDDARASAQALAARPTSRSAGSPRSSRAAARRSLPRRSREGDGGRVDPRRAGDAAGDGHRHGHLLDHLMRNGHVPGTVPGTCPERSRRRAVGGGEALPPARIAQRPAELPLRLGVRGSVVLGQARCPRPPWPGGRAIAESGAAVWRRSYPRGAGATRAPEPARRQRR